MISTGIHGKSNDFEYCILTLVCANPTEDTSALDPTRTRRQTGDSPGPELKLTQFVDTYMRIQASVNWYLRQNVNFTVHEGYGIINT